MSNRLLWQFCSAVHSPLPPHSHIHLSIYLSIPPSLRRCTCLSINSTIHSYYSRNSWCGSYQGKFKNSQFLWPFLNWRKPWLTRAWVLPGGKRMSGIGCWELNLPLFWCRHPPLFRNFKTSVSTPPSSWVLLHSVDILQGAGKPDELEKQLKTANGKVKVPHACSVSVCKAIMVMLS